MMTHEFINEILLYDCFIGLEVISPNEFEVVLYLNQMGVFNFVDDGTLPGCAVLKVGDQFLFILNLKIKINQMSVILFYRIFNYLTIYN